MHSAITFLISLGLKHITALMNLLRKQYSIRILSLLGVTLLTACTTVYLEEPKSLPFYQVESAIYQRLTSSGVRFVQLGDEVKILLPYNSWFFSADSLHLSPRSTPLLEDLVQLLNGLDYLRLTLKVYAAPGYETVADQQAIVLVDYLIHHGLDVRLLGVSCLLEKSPTKIRVYEKPHIELNLRLLHPEDME